MPYTVTPANPPPPPKSAEVDLKVLRANEVLQPGGSSDPRVSEAGVAFKVAGVGEMSQFDKAWGERSEDN